MVKFHWPILYVSCQTVLSITHFDILRLKKELLPTNMCTVTLALNNWPYMFALYEFVYNIWFFIAASLKSICLLENRNGWSLYK